MFDLGSVVAHIKADVTNFKEGINTVKKEVTGLSSTFAGIGTDIKNFGRQATIFTGVVGAGVAVFGKKSVEAFNEAERAMTQTQAVLKSTGGVAGVTAEHITKLSKAIQDTTPISDESARAAQNMLLTFTNIGKDVFDETTQATLDMATAMNGGLTPSIGDLMNNAKLLGKALQDPDAGLGALHRVGVNTDELSKKFTKNMTLMEKQKLILQELGTEFGGSAAAQAETYAGKMEMLKNKFNDFQERIGGVITGLQQFAVTGDLTTAFLNATGLQEGSPIIQGLVKFREVLVELGDWIVENKDLVITFLKGLAIGLGALLIIGTINGLVVALLNPLTLVVLAIAALYTAWETNFLGIKDITTAVFGFLVDIFQNYISPIIQQFSEMWKVTWEQNKTVFMFVWDLIVAITKTVIAVIGGIIIVFLALLSGNWKAAWENIKQIVSFAWEGIKNALNSGLAMIGGWARQVFDKLTQPFRDALAFIKDTVNKIKDNLDFTKRHSPSVLDIVNNGVDKVNSALSGLNFAPAIDLMPSSGQFAGAMQDVENSTRIVNQENVFNVHSSVDARIMSEQLAFDLRNI